ncbi:MAG: PD-(D/E)XK nuclease family protein [Phycisphaerales bacterium]|nr:PD-(D/E)XK nuclease family protein [Phycisphaerales bacterium]
MKKVYSSTKRSTLDRCSLQYFYQYYAPGYAPPEAPREPLLFQEPVALVHRTLEVCDSKSAASCKTLSSSSQVAGQILHNLIAQHWKGSDWEAERFKRAAVERYDFFVNASARNDRDSKTPRLLEHYYGLPNAGEILSTARTKLSVAVTNYFEHPAVVELVRDLLAGDESAPEVPIGGLPKMSGFSIGGRIDGWSKNASGIRIVDWKMGGSVGDEDCLQLAIYGWWAVERFKVSPETVSAQRVFLGDGIIERPFVMSERLIDRCRARLHQDIERMEELHEYGVNGFFEAFPPCQREKICRQCRFQGMCVALKAPV